MHPIRFHKPAWLVPLGLCAVALSATAQPTAPASHNADPLDAKAAVPGMVYESAIGRDRRKPDRPPIAWREANDNVARIGGWRAYAREAQQADPAAPAAPTPAAPAGPKAGDAQARPMPHGHGGHKMP